MAQALTTPAPATKRVVLHILNVVLSFGLCLVIARLGLNPRWRYAVWALIAANELRGLLMVYQLSDTAVSAFAG